MTEDTTVEDAVVDENTEVTEEKEVPDNIIQLDMFRGKRGIKQVEKKVAKGKKVTQQEAFSALMEMKTVVGAMMQSLEGLSQAVINHDAVLHVMVRMLDENGMDFTEHWKKYMKPPEGEQTDEEMLDAKLEEMKRSSADEVFFAEVIDRARNYTFEAQTIEEREFDADGVKDYYINLLLNPDTRVGALNELRELLPNMPEYQIAEPKETSEEVTDEQQKV